jgi:mRNA-degrading endonuclease RelE of RelBE toxin-antitoxin system
MRHRTSLNFWQKYWTLPQEIRNRADKQFLRLKTNPQHPSIQFKKLSERYGQEIYSARVTLDYRALAFKRPDGYFWFWIGNHKDDDNLIS